MVANSKSSRTSQHEGPRRDSTALTRKKWVLESGIPEFKPELCSVPCRGWPEWLVFTPLTGEHNQAAVAPGVRGSGSINNLLEGLNERL